MTLNRVMNNILDNELVLKYFGDNSRDPFCNQRMAYNILRAMEEPIKKGDKYLELMVNGIVREKLAEGVSYVVYGDPLHPYYLRLPDRFQKQECDCKCHSVHAGLCKCGVEGPTPEPECRHGRPLSEHCVNCSQAQEPEKCNCTRLPCWHGTMPKDEAEEYTVQFSSHGDSHEFFY